MRKVSILLVIALIATSCAVGTYYPYARNNFGAQSTVVLDKANFRVVRDVEAIVDVNNTRLSRADVASSAYGELLRKAQLTGSQVLINVVIEEVRRETAGFFRLLFGMPKKVQYVSARATVIEFLDETGNPVLPRYRYFGSIPSKLRSVGNKSLVFRVLLTVIGVISALQIKQGVLSKHSRSVPPEYSSSCSVFVYP